MTGPTKILRTDNKYCKYDQSLRCPDEEALDTAYLRQINKMS